MEKKMIEIRELENDLAASINTGAEATDSGDLAAACTMAGAGSTLRSAIAICQRLDQLIEQVKGERDEMKRRWEESHEEPPVAEEKKTAG